MSQFFQIHPENPQKRLIDQAVQIVRQGGVIAYPTDSGYALGCHLGDKKAIERIKRLRSLDDKHNFTLVCSDLSDIGTYAKVDNSVFRLLKANTPGAYTFILNATSEVPRLLLHPKRRSIGVRVPDHRITHALLEALGEPLMSVTLIPVGEELPMTDPEEIRDRYINQLDLIIDGGACHLEPTSVIDLRELPPTILREGRGDLAPFGD
ncbi:L-threonylcarbamoyladenylate synthase [Billgrantia desiderata]|uniref:Threonylcarbamoyl-AMP synthase n=1 Tax=Billgrantia desiderata TaxID=52021 RepID=A0AAW4YR24_9GAMM|nr:L-threonylcarbamoyladenylate synthase [Halomonas desiderata]MCE8050520.1 threonylcarbamoyl-AMP synthase [Halomonas desiderata]NIC37819.1 threonylcarbamoyl-AMP synthase [Halomonas desiderata]OUE43900.1 threonylcarbamoyl-AMP synthase [Halomonas desiderata SP1]